MSAQQIVFTVIILVLLLVVAFWVAKRRKKTSVTVSEADGPESNKQVYIGNLPYQVTEQNLRDLFGKYGQITQVRIVRNYRSGRSKGFGFVTYAKVDEAQKSLVSHGQKYEGRNIVVRIAKPR